MALGTCAFHGVGHGSLDKDSRRVKVGREALVPRGIFLVADLTALTTTGFGPALEDVSVASLSDSPERGGQMWSEGFKGVVLRRQ